MLLFVSIYVGTLDGGISPHHLQDGGGLVCGWGLSLLIFSFPAQTCLGCLVRFRIEGDEVQVIHPFLGRWGNRAFRFVEIASVEVRVVVNGRKVVRIGLHDGSSIRYRTWDETETDELVGPLEWGVAQAKPASLDWSELP